MSLPNLVRRLTEVEYLEIERQAEFKSEFFDGEMFSMAGGSPEHSLIATNLAREFGNLLKKHPSTAYNNDLRVKIEATGLNTYPDLTVVCGPLRFVDNERDTIVNPTLIVEVLSSSTEAYDRGKKFDQYQRVPTLREYLLVSQTEPRIEQFIRQEGGGWLWRAAASVDATLALPALGITIMLGEIFAKVAFKPSPIRPPNPPRQ